MPPQTASHDRGSPKDIAVSVYTHELQLLFQTLGKGYLVGEPMEDAPGEVEHVGGPRDLGIHVFDANEPADGDNGPVAVEAIA